MDRRFAEPDQPAPPLEAAEPAPGIETTTDEDALLGRADDRARRREYAAALELYLAASLMALDKRGAAEGSRGPHQRRVRPGVRGARRRSPPCGASSARSTG